MTKQKAGIGRLLSAMKKNIREVNDQEICRRLEILMYSEKEDISPQLVKRVLESTHYDLEPKEIPEPYTQYVKHYFYMLKRENRLKEKEGIAPRFASRKKISQMKAVEKTQSKAAGKTPDAVTKVNEKKTSGAAHVKVSKKKAAISKKKTKTKKKTS